MTRDQLKQFFRQYFKVVPGGPASGPAGKTRSAGVLTSLDKLVDESEPSFAPITPTELRPGAVNIAGLNLREALIALANAGTALAPVIAPVITNPVITAPPVLTSASFTAA